MVRTKHTHPQRRGFLRTDEVKQKGENERLVGRSIVSLPPETIHFRGEQSRSRWYNIVWRESHYQFIWPLSNSAAAAAATVAFTFP